MTPTLILVLGLAVFAASVWGMYRCSADPKFGLCECGAPTFVTFLASFLWAPLVFGAILAFGSLGCLILGYGL